VSGSEVVNVSLAQFNMFIMGKVSLKYEQGLNGLRQRFVVVMRGVSAIYDITLQLFSIAQKNKMSEAVGMLESNIIVLQKII